MFFQPEIHFLRCMTFQIYNPNFTVEVQAVKVGQWKMAFSVFNSERQWRR